MNFESEINLRSSKEKTKYAEHGATEPEKIKHAKASLKKLLKLKVDQISEKEKEFLLPS